MRTNRDNSLLLVIHIQRKLAPHVAGHEQLIRRTEALLDAAGLFGIPKLLTEHCPAQISTVIEPLRSRFAAGQIFEKTCFGAADHRQFVALVRQQGRARIVITGMEAHVCVMQTALGLREHGFDVVVVADAVGSREARQADRELALRRMQRAGCVLAGCTDPQFRTLLSIVKSL